MFHRNINDVVVQIKQLLFNRTKNEPPKLLVDCMEATGYIIQQEQSPEQDIFEEVEYREIKNKGYQEQQFMTGIQELGQVSMISGTSIQETLNPKFQRLKITQTYGISNEEMTDKYLNELFDSVLNNVSIEYQELVNLQQIKQYSIQMYHSIEKVYRDTNIFKGEIKGRIKRGYTMLVLYYGLLNFEICISRQKLVVFFNNFDKFSESDLAEADKNIKMMFDDDNLPSENEICLCNIKPLLNRQQIVFIKNEIKRLQELGIFHKPAQSVQIATLIHHHIKEISLKEISKRSGITTDTIRKSIKYFNFS
jgi:hypothetical protein